MTREELKAQIDEFDTSNVTNMEGMFIWNCQEKCSRETPKMSER